MPAEAQARRFTSQQLFGTGGVSRVRRVCDQRAAVGVAKQVSALYRDNCCVRWRPVAAQRGVQKVPNVERLSSAPNPTKAMMPMLDRLEDASACPLPTHPGVLMLPSVLQPLARLVSSSRDVFAPSELLLSPRDSLAVIFQSTS